VSYDYWNPFSQKERREIIANERDCFHSRAQAAPNSLLTKSLAQSRSRKCRASPQAHLGPRTLSRQASLISLDTTSTKSKQFCQRRSLPIVQRLS
jgi:hypothetical protein